MFVFYTIVIVILLLCLIIGLVRVLAGPDNANRMLAAQLFGSIGITIIVVLSVLQANEVIANVALVLQANEVIANVALVCTLLASITIIAFLKLAEQPIDNPSATPTSDEHDS